MKRTKSEEAQRGPLDLKGKTAKWGEIKERTETLKKARKLLHVDLITEEKQEALERLLRNVKAELKREAKQYVISVNEMTRGKDKGKKAISVFYEPKGGKRETAIKYLRFSKVIANKWNARSQKKADEMGEAIESLINISLQKAEKIIVSRAKKTEIEALKKNKAEEEAIEEESEFFELKEPYTEEAIKKHFEESRKRLLEAIARGEIKKADLIEDYRQTIFFDYIEEGRVLTQEEIESLSIEKAERDFKEAEDLKQAKCIKQSENEG